MGHGRYGGRIHITDQWTCEIHACNRTSKLAEDRVLWQEDECGYVHPITREKEEEGEGDGKSGMRGVTGGRQDHRIPISQRIIAYNQTQLVVLTAVSTVDMPHWGAVPCRYPPPPVPLYLREVCPDATWTTTTS